MAICTSLPLLFKFSPFEYKILLEFQIQYIANQWPKMRFTIGINFYIEAFIVILCWIWMQLGVLSMVLLFYFVKKYCNAVFI